MDSMKDEYSRLCSYDVFEAADTLTFMKHQNLSKDEARKLEILMAERDVHHHHQGRSRNKREEETMNSSVPEDFPVGSLRQFVKKCSIKAIEKQLTCTDTKGEHNRLNLVKCLVEELFLPMLKEEEDVKRGIPVTTYDENGNEYAMKFVLWSNKYYVLNGGWKQFCKRRGLQQLEDYVQVWMFRHSQTDNLCFVITHRRKPLLQRLRIEPKN